LLRPGREAARLVDIAVFAVPDVELVADDWPVHGMGAERQLAVNDGVIAEIFGEIGSAAGIPTRAMSGFRIHDVRIQ
jgi:hypothetical protein